MPNRGDRLIDDLLGRLRGAPGRLLLLDYDGTLAPFVVERNEAVPYAGAREAVEGIIRGGKTRVVLVSGRMVREVQPLLAIEPAPEIWGSHGWEHQAEDGNYTIMRLPEEALRGLADADAWVEAEGLEGLREAKPGALALHVRGLPEEEGVALLEAAAEAWTALLASSGLELRPFDGGLELRAPGRSKADVLREVLATMPAGTAMAFLGDDLTDEDGFAAIGEEGLGILVRREFRPTCAKAWLRPPEELLEFLARWRAAEG